MGWFKRPWEGEERVQLTESNFLVSTHNKFMSSGWIMPIGGAKVQPGEEPPEGETQGTFSWSGSSTFEKWTAWRRHPLEELVDHDPRYLGHIEVKHPYEVERGSPLVGEACWEVKAHLPVLLEDGEDAGTHGMATEGDTPLWSYEASSAEQARDKVMEWAEVLWGQEEDWEVSGEHGRT